MESMQPPEDAPRIVTLTLNPALDLSTETERVEPERKLRCTAARRDPGGGGINVARVVNELGGEALAVVALGGPVGELVAEQLAACGVEFVAVEVEGGTRQSLTVTEQASGRQYRFVLPGPPLRPEEWVECMEATVAAAAGVDLVVASSSLPPGVPDDAFAALAARLHEHGIPVAVDTSGPALRAAIAAPVAFVKPSANELRAAAGRDLDREADYEQAARELLAEGRCGAIVVSLGAAGALAVARDEEALLVRAPAVRVVSAVGAGDSMVAAMALSLARGQPLREAARWGVAAGTAAVLTPGTALCTRADVEAVAERVTVSAVPGEAMRFSA